MVFIWVRGTLPRLRMDQLMNFAWKFMLPLALMNIVVAGVLALHGAGFARWVACWCVDRRPCRILAHAVACESKIQKRVYRYAD